METNNRIHQLTELIRLHNYHYWVLNKPLISDEAFDTLIRELKSLDPNNLVLYQRFSPIDATFRQRVQHKTPVYSLEKVYTLNEIVQWFNKISRTSDEQILVQPKYDGCSAEYRSDDGLLVSAGNEPDCGFNITDKKPIITVVSPFYTGPLDQCRYDVRGEVIITQSLYNEYKEIFTRKDKSLYTDARTMTSAILNQKNIPQAFQNKHGFNRILTLVDFNMYYSIIKLNELAQIDLDYLMEQAKGLGFGIDGLVFKLRDFDYGNSLGFTAHHPRANLAFKPSYGPIKETTLLDVDFQVGKNVICPVGIIDPVEIDGFKVSRANMHNANYILSKNIHIGDTLMIRRSGGIIPDIVESYPSSSARIPIVINECPACQSELDYREPFLYCTNSDCPGTQAIKLRDAVKRLNINKLGVRTIEKLINININRIDQILKIQKLILKQLPGFNEKSAQNIYDEIQKIINSPIEDWRILSCLNIHLVGKNLSKKILQHLTLDELQSATLEKILEIPQIGEIKGRSIFYELQNNKDLLNNLQKIFSKITTTKNQQQNKPTICFSGEFPKKKKVYHEMAMKAGYEIKTSVTKNLSYLVVNDLNNSTTKLQKAQQQNINVIDLNTFYYLVKRYVDTFYYLVENK